MTVTMQSVVDLARLDLNDADKTRSPDSELLSFANDGIGKAYVLRPDLRGDNYADAYVDLALTDPFPLSLEYRSAIANYIVFRAETADDAFANEQRAIVGMKLFRSDLGLA
jgi:hypothetical protein